jgi:WD40 repeat protein
MFNRSFAVAALTLAALVAAYPATAQSVSHLFESRDHYTGPVAKKVVEFKDQFYVAALAFNGDGTRLAANFMVSDDGVHVWRWRESPPVVEKLVKTGGSGDGEALSYSPDGTLLAVRQDPTNENKIIRIWNAKSGQLVHDIGEPNRGDSRGIAFTPDGKLLIRAIIRNIYQPGDQVVVHRTDTWEVVWSLRTMPFQPDLLAMSPDGKLLAMSGADEFGLKTPPIIKIAFLDIAMRKIVRSIDAPFPGYVRPSALAWSPDGLHIAAAGDVGGSSPGPEAVIVFDAVTGKRIATVNAKSASAEGLAYSPDGKYLIAGSIDNSVRIMDGRNYILLQSIPGDGRSVAVSRDSRYLAISAFPKFSIWMLK